MKSYAAKQLSFVRTLIPCRSRRLSLTAALSLFFLTASAAFASCDHPGTANPVLVKPLDSTTFQILITNTAREGTDHDIWFEVEDQQGHAHRKNFGHIPYGRTVSDLWNVNDGVRPSQTSCFHVWTRDDSLQGCRSDSPGAWVCGTTPAMPTGGSGGSGGAGGSTGTTGATGTTGICCGIWNPTGGTVVRRQPQ